MIGNAIGKADGKFVHQKSLVNKNYYSDYYTHAVSIKINEEIHRIIDQFLISHYGCGGWDM